MSCRVAHDTIFFFGKICHESCRVAHDIFFILKKNVIKLVVCHTTSLSCATRHFLFVQYLSCGTRHCRVPHDTVVCILVETLINHIQECNIQFLYKNGSWSVLLQQLIP